MIFSVRLYIALLLTILQSAMPLAQAEAATFSASTVAEIETALTTSASNGEDDTINIVAGTYTVGSPLSYDSTEDNSITIQNISGEVVIDGENVTRVLYASTTQDNADITIGGITFQKGFIIKDTGATVFLQTHSANITIENSQFNDGWSSSFYFSSNAGGLFARTQGGGTISINDSVFANNYAKGIGGGLYINAAASTTVVLTNNLFVSNEASTQGGGLYLSAIGSNVAIVNNTFTQNTTGYGSGGGGFYLRLYNDTASADIYNNIIWGNNADNLTGEDIFLENDGDANGTASAVNLYNNDYADLESQIASGITLSGNIDQDPLLTSDYHIGDGSPCIDAGLPTAPSIPSTDFDGGIRIFDGGPDIGADEYGSIWIPTLTNLGALLLIALMLVLTLGYLKPKHS